jgi:hypothetical protein
VQDSEHILAAQFGCRIAAWMQLGKLTSACHMLGKALLSACAACVSYCCVCCGLQGY